MGRVKRAVTFILRVTLPYLAWLKINPAEYDDFVSVGGKGRHLLEPTKVFRRHRHGNYWRTA